MTYIQSAEVAAAAAGAEADQRGYLQRCQINYPFAAAGVAAAAVVVDRRICQSQWRVGWLSEQVDRKLAWQSCPNLSSDEVSDGLRI